MGNDPANLTDPTGGCATCMSWVQSFAENFSTLQNVTVIGKAKVVSTASKISKSFNDAKQTLGVLASSLSWNMGGFSAALMDNAFGTDLLTSNAPSSNSGSDAINNWHAGIASGNAASMALAVMEGQSGSSMMAGGMGAIAGAAATGPGALPAAAGGALTVVAGAGVTYHSFHFFGRAVANTVSMKGMVKFESEVQPSESGGGNSAEGTTTGTQVNSKTLWKGDGKERIDVENPNPTQRPGQIHYQDNSGNKYIYDQPTNTFRDAPNKVNKLIDKPEIKKAIEKGLKYLNG